MRPRLPDDRKRSRTLEVYMPDDEMEEARLEAMRRGFRRRVAGSKPAVFRGDLSKLIHDILRDAARDPVTWGRVRARLQALHEPLAPPPGGHRKFQMRVREVWLDRIRRLAADAGFVHGGRGNVSTLVRDLLRLAIMDRRRASGQVAPEDPAASGD